MTPWHISGRIVYEEKGNKFDTWVYQVVGAQMLITAKHAEPRSGKSVRESKAALKQYFF